MTKEEFKIKSDDYSSKIQSLENQVKELKKEKRELKEMYVQEFREFQNGDLVNVTHGRNRKTEKAFISTATEHDGKILYSFIQVKKDGKPSSRVLYVDSYSWSTEVEIELINTEYRNKNFDGTEITQ